MASWKITCLLDADDIFDAHWPQSVKINYHAENSSMSRLYWLKWPKWVTDLCRGGMKNVIAHKKCIFWEKTKRKCKSCNWITFFRCATLSCISPPAFSQWTDASNSRSSPPKTSQHPHHHSPNVGVTAKKKNQLCSWVAHVSNHTFVSPLKHFLSKWRCTSWGMWWLRRRLVCWRLRGVSVSGRRLFISPWLR